MTFLNPLALLGLVAVAVPLILHLLHRRVGRRRAFPALRYLRRTEREHASRIRLRQILLLLVRTAILLLLVLAAARPLVRGLGDEHEPTALAVVLDNSMSSGMVVGETRVLDELAEAALASVAAAGPDDRIWVFRGGEPWETPRPGGPAEARARIEATSAVGTAASLPRIVERARSLVRDAGLPAAEVHVFSDLQATSWAREDDPGGGAARPRAGADSAGGAPPVLVYHPDAPAARNRWVSSVEVGGGLAPLINQRTEIAVRIDGAGGSGTPIDGDTVRARLTLDDRIVAAVDAPLGEEILIPAGPFAPGRVRGFVEIDPDALRADDRRYFAFRVRPPPAVGLAADPGFFLRQALAVLVDAGRIRRSQTDPDLWIAPGARGLAGADSDAAVVILAPSDPALLPASNQGLREADVPWRLENPRGGGGGRVEGIDLPVSLDGIRVRSGYRLVRISEGEDAGDVRARRGDGSPWLVTGRAGGRPYLLLASPLEPEATSLPLTAEMVPVVEWMLSGWAAGPGGGSDARSGHPLHAPPAATGVRDPDGTLHPVDGTLPFRRTVRPGIYEIVRGDSVLERVALNPPTRESEPERLEPGALSALVAPPLRTASSPGSWSDEIFRARRGREVWRPLLLAALALLALESVLAAGGRGRDLRAGGGAGAGTPSREPTTELGSDA